MNDAGTTLDSPRSVAKLHGVEFDSVVPLSQRERLTQLREILDRQDVAFPIGRQTAAAYFRQAESGEPFGIGSLSHESVNLENFENRQVYSELTFNDHLSWACLVADQQLTKHDHACQEYLNGEKLFEIGGNVIPDFYALNARIFQQTQWQLATVSEIIPANVFFRCHSHKFFPVTTFMRPLGTDYLEEPDIGHDVAGHVATFTIPQVAQVMNNHGLANDLIHQEKELKIKAATNDEEIQRIEDETTELLQYAGRLYWFTVEFGLVLQDDQLKVFGAGILSSPGETVFSIASSKSNRILIDPTCDRDLLRLATTDYLICEFQKTYFVMKNFESLASLTPQRILETVHAAQKLPHYTWREVAPGDNILNVGTGMMSPNEKYFRLLAGQPLDECLLRTAIRNLRMQADGFSDKDLCQTQFDYLESMPVIPADILRLFADADNRGDFILDKT